MIEKELYPATQRMPEAGIRYQVTEKLDGSNLAFIKKEGKLYVAVRKAILTLDEINDPKFKKFPYKGLQAWLNEHGKDLEERIYEGSVVNGEWIGMGSIKYRGTLKHRFHMFAKSRITEDWKLEKVIYDHTLLHYVFNDGIIPEYIGIVPLAGYLSSPNKEVMDEFYDDYAPKQDHPVEGFVLSDNNNHIMKYLRYKNGKPVAYSENDHKGKTDE